MYYMKTYILDMYGNFDSYIIEKGQDDIMML